MKLEIKRVGQSLGFTISNQKGFNFHPFTTNPEFQKDWNGLCIRSESDTKSIQEYLKSSLINQTEPLKKTGETFHYKIKAGKNNISVFIIEDQDLRNIDNLCMTKIDIIKALREVSNGVIDLNPENSLMKQIGNNGIILNMPTNNGEAREIIIPTLLMNHIYVERERRIILPSSIKRSASA